MNELIVLSVHATYTKYVRVNYGCQCVCVSLMTEILIMCVCVIQRDNVLMCCFTYRHCLTMHFSDFSFYVNETNCYGFTYYESVMQICTLATAHAHKFPTDQGGGKGGD